MKISNLKKENISEVPAELLEVLDSAEWYRNSNVSFRFVISRGWDAAYELFTSQEFLSKDECRDGLDRVLRAWPTGRVLVCWISADGEVLDQAACIGGRPLAEFMSV